VVSQTEIDFVYKKTQHINEKRSSLSVRNILSFLYILSQFMKPPSVVILSFVVFVVFGVDLYLLYRFKFLGV
jgi:hypothetical protein